MEWAALVEILGPLAIKAIQGATGQTALTADDLRAFQAALAPAVAKLDAALAALDTSETAFENEIAKQEAEKPPA